MVGWLCQKEVMQMSYIYIYQKWISLVSDDRGSDVCDLVCSTGICAPATVIIEVISTLWGSYTCYIFLGRGSILLHSPDVIYNYYLSLIKPLCKFHFILQMT